MIDAAGMPGLEEPPQSLDDPGPSWCAVANVVEEHPFGPDGAEIRRGTRHFAPGAKVHFVTAYWGSGDVVTVVGRHRASHRFITLAMNAHFLRNWRTELAYSPHVTRIMAERGEYTGHGRDAPASPEAKRCANEFVARFTWYYPPADPPGPPISGPIPDAFKSLLMEWGPSGIWIAMQPHMADRGRPGMIRFGRDGTGVILPVGADGPACDPVGFLWRCIAPGSLRLRRLVPDEPIPADWKCSPAGSGWDEVAYELRLVVLHTAAFEALAEKGSEGFWTSPVPLLWAGPALCTAS